MFKINHIDIQCSHCNKKFSIENNNLDTVTCPYCATKLDLNANSDLIIKPPKQKTFSNILLKILSVFIGIPIFIILRNSISELNIPQRIVDIALVIILFLAIYYLLLSFKRVIYLLFLLIIILLSIGSSIHQYGFKNLYEDYNALLLILKENPQAKEIIIEKLIPFKKQSEIEKAVEFDNEKVRNFALTCTTKHFNEYVGGSDYRILIQSFAIFKEINTNWNYVNDPKSREYFAKAGESLEHLSGDCDDYSILMVSAIKAIGGQARIIHTTGHMYPEVLMGKKKDLETVNYLIKRKLFPEVSKGKSLFYHVDENNLIWLNLDYTAKYPGGPFMDEEILGIFNYLS